MNFKIFQSEQLAAQDAAISISNQVKKNPHSSLGLATGSSVLNLYAKMSELSHQENISYAGVKSYNLDEYIGCRGNENHSFQKFMEVHLFGRLNNFNNHTNAFFPKAFGTNLDRNCEDYNKRLRAAGPLDIQVLGVGVNGHIAFNEPGTDYNALTHVVKLAFSTIEHNKTAFSDYSKVPKQAITMGIKSIVSAKKIILLCFGKSKQDIAKYIFEEPLNNKNYNPKHPVSALFSHPNCDVYFDDIALAKTNHKI